MKPSVLKRMSVHAVAVIAALCAVVSGMAATTPLPAVNTPAPNHPPVARSQNVTVTAGSNGSAIASINNKSSDTDAGDSITLTQTPAGPYAVGTTVVILTVTDSHGASASATATVKVIDTTAPTLTVPAPIVASNESGRCDAVVNFTVTAADNSSAVTVVSTPASGSTFAKGTTVVTNVATDASGNKTSKTFTVTVKDTEAPTLTVPDSIVVSNAVGRRDAVVKFTVTAADNCSAVTVVNSRASGSAFAVGTTVVTSVATDASGNKTSKTFTVTVNDTEAPTLTVPAPIVVGNIVGRSEAVVSFRVTAADNCSGVTVISTPASGSTFAVGTSVVTSVATDASGNKASKTFTVTVKDTQAPALTVPAAMVVSNDPGSCDAVVNFTVTAADNSSAVTVVSMPASGSTFAKGITVVTNVATDVFGNKTSKNFTVTVKDTEAPTLTVPAPIVVSNAAGRRDAVVNFTVTAVDNCSAVTVVNTRASGSAFAVGTTVVTSVATDASGNKTSKTFTVKVNDTEAPTLTVPAPIVVGNILGRAEAVVSFKVTPADNCLGVTVVSTPASGSTFGMGTTVVASVATDASGNTTSKNFTVTVKDTQAPTLTVPAAIVVSNEPGNCDAVVTFTVTASDNCSGVTVVSTPASGSTFGKGTTVVANVATDASGNKTSKNFTVTVKDTQAPTLAVPDSIVVSNEPGNCGAVVTFTVTAADNCSGVTVVSTPASGSNFPAGTTVVTSVAKDASGNKTSKTFTVTVNDTEAPTLMVPDPIVASNEPGRCDAVVTFTVTAADNCSGATVVSTPASGSIFSKGTTVVTSVATDASGNTTSKTFTVTVKDTQAPTLTVPAPIVASNEPGRCDAVVIFTVTAADNCSGATVVNTPASGSIFSKGTTVVTSVATDGSGNTTSKTFTVTVKDTEAPKIVTQASNKIVECDGAGNTTALNAWLASQGGALATENCSGVTWSHNFTALSDGSGATGSATVTFTATDSDGNSSNSVATFTIVDTTAPVLTSNVRDIQPKETSITFIVTGQDICCSGVTVTLKTRAYKINGSGKEDDKSKELDATIIGNQVTISHSGGVGTIIEITADGVDDCGNNATQKFLVNVLNSEDKGKGNDDAGKQK